MLLQLAAYRCTNVHMMDMPGRLQTISHAKTSANQALGVTVIADTDKHDLLLTPWTPQCSWGLLGFEPFIHDICKLSQGQLSQRNQIACSEEIRKRLRNLVSCIDFTLSHALPQGLGATSINCTSSAD